MRRERSGSMPPLLRDVAAAAGVSLSTASRALSGSGASAETMAAVLAASERLGYHPDPVARAMRTRSTGLVGIIVPGVSNPFFAELVEALEGALRSHDHEIILGNSGGSVEEEARMLETMVHRKVDGLIVIPAQYHASTAALCRAARRVATVQVDRQVDGLVGDYVGVDNSVGVRAVLEHLAAQGCRDIVFASDAGSASTGQARHLAFTEAVRQVVDPSTKSPVFTASRPPMLGSFSLEFGREVVRQLGRRSLPDAIVCGDDLVALGVVREFREYGVAVPEEVKVTGFDGILFAELCDPELTTVRQPVAAIAAEAARLLDTRLSGDPSPPHRSEIAPVLVVRRSSSAMTDWAEAGHPGAQRHFSPR